MSDEQNIPGPEQPAPPQPIDEVPPGAVVEGEPAVPEAATDVSQTTVTDNIKGFFASPFGRVLVIGGGVAVLAVIGLLVWVFASGVFNAPPEVEVVTRPESSATVAGTASVEPSAAPAPAADEETAPAAPGRVARIENEDVFIPRDPFVPVHLSDTETGLDKAAESGQLTLEAIVKETDQHHWSNVTIYRAVLNDRGESRKVGVGDYVGNGQWLVMDITKTYVTLEFGDEATSLGVGSSVRVVGDTSYGSSK